jgi:trans-aconitate methyltransferase
MGCGDGNTTRILLESFADVTVVDGSRQLADKVAGEFPAVTVACELFERWEPGRSFDTIVLNHIARARERRRRGAAPRRALARP